MDGQTTVKYLQSYIRAKDHHPELAQTYMLKLTEEVGELSRAVRKGLRRTDSGIKDTIGEELWDVIYYVIALANIHDFDLETAIRDKEAINNIKYQTGMTFEAGR